MRAAIATYLVLHGLACGPAPDASRVDDPMGAEDEVAEETPLSPVPIRVDSVCVGEGCVFGTWLTCRPATAFASPEEGSDEAFRLLPGDSVSVSNGVVIAAAPPVLEVPPQAELRQAAAPDAPDSAQLLYYEGEGRFVLWYAGGLARSRPFWADGSVPDARSALEESEGVEYWLEARNSEGTRGWILNRGRVIAEENLRDPSAPWCPRS